MWKRCKWHSTSSACELAQEKVEGQLNVSTYPLKQCIVGYRENGLLLQNSKQRAETKLLLFQSAGGFLVFIHLLVCADFIDCTQRRV